MFYTVSKPNKFHPPHENHLKYKKTAHTWRILKLYMPDVNGQMASEANVLNSNYCQYTLRYLIYIDLFLKMVSNDFNRKNQKKVSVF